MAGSQALDYSCLCMRQAIDDFPFLRASRMRAAGQLTAGMRTATVFFPGDDRAFTVALALRSFPNGGDWSYFICSCGRCCRTLRLYNGSLACKRCLEARGLRYRVEDLSRPDRAAHVASRLKVRLTSASPARINPRPGRILDRRPNLELAFKRSRIVERRAKIARFEKDLGET